MLVTSDDVGHRGASLSERLVVVDVANECITHNILFQQHDELFSLSPSLKPFLFPFIG